MSLVPVDMDLHATGGEQATIVRLGIGSDRPPTEPAMSKEGVPSWLVIALSLVIPPAWPPGTAPAALQDAAALIAGGGGGGSGAIAVGWQPFQHASPATRPRLG